MIIEVTLKLRKDAGTRFIENSLAIPNGTCLPLYTVALDFVYPFMSAHTDTGMSAFLNALAAWKLFFVPTMHLDDEFDQDLIAESVSSLT